MLGHMKKSKLTLDVEKKLTSKVKSNKKTSHTNEYFIKGKGLEHEKCRLKFLNLTMPEVKAALKEINVKNNWTFSEAEQIWFETDIFEVRTLAGYWLDQQNMSELQANYKKVFNWATIIDNWAHSDQLCAVYARLLEHIPKQVLPIYLKWNRHKNSWLRRCSIVGLFYYSRQRRKQPQFEFAAQMVKPHFVAEEYYVQKGVGWTIREMYNVYPEKTLDFIDLSLKQIHPDAWYAASEKLPASTKSKLLKKRKVIRAETRLKIRHNEK